MEKTRVLIAIDEPEFAEKIVKITCNLINKNNAEITLINVLETTTAEEEFFVREPEKFIKHESKKNLFPKIEEYLNKNNYDYKGLILKQGKAAQEILELCKQNKYNLISLGCNNKGFFEKILLGSTSYKVIRDSKCSVLVIKAGKEETIEKNKNIEVLVATDGSDCSRHVAQRLDTYLDTKKNNISVMTTRVPLGNIIPHDAYAYTDISKIIEESKLVACETVNDIVKIIENKGFKVKNKYHTEGDPAVEILNEEKNYDLLVVGSHGKNELSRFFMGSTSSKVYENATKSVLLIKRIK